MSDRVRITDVSPRDGLQNERGVVPTADKVRLVELLARSGVDEIEATSFVSPKWIPQLGDAEDVLTALRSSDEITSHPARLTVLIPNEKGFERAKRFHSDSFPLKIAVFTAASETFNRKNTNATIEESIERFRAFVPGALELGMPVRLYVSTAVACPYEGAIAPEQVRRVCDQLLQIVPQEHASSGRVELDLGDTIGAATPESIGALLHQFESSERAALTLHLHDTFGGAAGCVRAALELGVRSFDGSVAGLGGCPYAGTPEQPAPGNLSTEALISAILDAGFSSGVDLDALSRAASFAREIIGRARASSV